MYEPGHPIIALGDAGSGCGRAVSRRPASSSLHRAQPLGHAILELSARRASVPLRSAVVHACVQTHTTAYGCASARREDVAYRTSHRLVIASKAGARDRTTGQWLRRVDKSGRMRSGNRGRVCIALRSDVKANDLERIHGNRAVRNSRCAECADLGVRKGCGGERRAANAAGQLGSPDTSGCRGMACCRLANAADAHRRREAHPWLAGATHMLCVPLLFRNCTNKLFQALNVGQSESVQQRMSDSVRPPPNSNDGRRCRRRSRCPRQGPVWEE